MPFIGRFLFEWLPDGRNMELQSELKYFSNKYKLMFTIQIGERTDGLSIPRWLWFFAGSPFTGKARKGAVIHDYLYRNGYGGTPIVSREIADDIFYEAMLECGVSKAEALTKYKAVRWFGPRW